MKFSDYKYRIQYPRTGDWWQSRWYELSTWCNNTYGPGNWEYIDRAFAFLSNEDKLMFKLRWPTPVIR